MTQRRRPRSDRTHYIYCLVIAGERYVGVTAKTESTARASIQHRVARHWQRAWRENRAWRLCEAIRRLRSIQEIEVQVLAAVRGKSLAHQEEVRLRRELGATLNTDRRGDVVVDNG